MLRYADMKFTIYVSLHSLFFTQILGLFNLCLKTILSVYYFICWKEETSHMMY